MEAGHFPACKWHPGQQSPHDGLQTVRETLEGGDRRGGKGRTVTFSRRTHVCLDDEASGEPMRRAGDKDSKNKTSQSTQKRDTNPTH